MDDFETKKRDVESRWEASRAASAVARGLIDSLVADPESVTQDKLIEIRRLMRANDDTLKSLQQDVARLVYTGR